MACHVQAQAYLEGNIWRGKGGRGHSYSAKYSSPGSVEDLIWCVHSLHSRGLVNIQYT